jgi:hypothetical protein|tara:strand:+ start:266 stop:529 length:264 start_codon:yes stop_codon:yes gene_type:complete
MNCSEIKHDLYSYFLTNSFLEIFQENTKVIKLTIMPENAPKIRSSRKTQVRTNATSDGTVIIIAIMVPLSIISDIVSLVDFSLSDNS